MNSIPDQNETLLKERDAARLFLVSPRTLQAWRTKPDGPPFIRIGRSIRYGRIALQNWISRRNAQPQ